MAGLRAGLVACSGATCGLDDRQRCHINPARLNQVSCPSHWGTQVQRRAVHGPCQQLDTVDQTWSGSGGVGIGIDGENGSRTGQLMPTGLGVELAIPRLGLVKVEAAESEEDHLGPSSRQLSQGR